MISTMVAPNSSGSPGAFEQLQEIGGEEGPSTMTNGTISSAGLPPRPVPQLPDDDEAEQPVHHHGGRDRDAIGGGERARGAEQADQQQHADQQRHRHARNVDLAGLRCRGVQDRQPRQQAELDRLMHQRIGAGDHRLAGDHRRRRRQHDHRQQKHVRHQPVERVFDRRRIGQHLGALAEIIDQQRRQHQAEPGGLDRLAAEMAEIGIERLAAGHRQEYRAERDQADRAVGEQEVDAVVAD